MVYKWLNIIQNICLPPVCALCSEAALAHLALCNHCHKHLEFLENSCKRCALPLPSSCQTGVCGRCICHPPEFDLCISLFPYEGTIRSLVLGLKFNKQLRNARLLGQLLADHITMRQHALPDCLVPVPLSRQRIRERSYNQSLELARPLQKHLHIPINLQLVRRVRHTPPQSQLKFAQRAGNLHQAFAPGKGCIPEHVAIIDDVVTSGATANAIARVLKDGGAKTVEVWSIARSIKK